MTGSAAALADALFEHAAARDIDGAVALARTVVETGDSTVAVEAMRLVQDRVGSEWYRAAWTVADEHGATAVVDAALAVVQVTRPPASSPPVADVVVACPEGEWHSLPARIFAVQLREMGARVTFLGASMPADHLALDLVDRRPDVLALSVATPLGLPAAIATIDAAHGVGVPVVVGGRALGADARRADALGADGWAPDASGLLGLLPIEPLHGAPEGRGARESAVFALELERPAVVERAFALLAERFPPLVRYDRRQIARTREDLDDIARFVEVAVLVDDPGLFDDFVEWLAGLLAARGVPRAALGTSLRCLADAAGSGHLAEHAGVHASRLECG